MNINGDKEGKEITAMTLKIRKAMPTTTTDLLEPGRYFEPASLKKSPV